MSRRRQISDAILRTDGGKITNGKLFRGDEQRKSKRQRLKPERTMKIRPSSIMDHNSGKPEGPQGWRGRC